MKRLVSLLLTVVLATCLISSNNKVVKASLAVGIELDRDSATDDASPISIDTTDGTVSSGSLTWDNVNKVYIMDGFNYSYSGDACVWVTKSTTLVLKNSNSITAVPSTPVGIMIGDGVTLTIKTENGSNTPTLSISCLSGRGISSSASTGAKLLVKSGTVKTTTGTLNGVSLDYLEVENGILFSTTTVSEEYPAIKIDAANGFSITGTGKVTAISYGYALRLKSTDTYYDSAFIAKGDVNYPTDLNNLPNQNSLSDVSFIPIGGDYNASKINSSVANYVVLYKDIPTPNPQVVDTTCEAVIGPRWHWNNDKGICEQDYSVINTATY